MHQTPLIKHMYEKLVESEEDFIGIVAYSIYKRQKQVFLKEQESKGSKRVNPRAMQQFLDLASSESQIKLYREQAAKLTKEFTVALLDEKKEEIFYYALEKIGKKGFWGFMYGVSQSLVANLIWLGLLAIIALILWKQGNSIL